MAPWKAGMPPLFPDSILFEIFLRMDYADVLSAGLACRQWHAVARDEFLWKELFYRHYQIPRDIPRHPDAVSWYAEFQRLHDTVPCVEVQTLTEHTDQVLHLSFAHNGCQFASCSKDSTVKIWKNDLQVSLLHSTSMKKYNWNYTQFSQFNAGDFLLLVSGVLAPEGTLSGEIAILSLDDFTVLYRVCNKPYDIFGCWLTETNLISNNLQYTDNLASLSVLWLNNAFLGFESENAGVAKHLFKFYNINASTVRSVMVADCGPCHGSQDLPDPGESTEEGAGPPPQVVDPYSDSEEEEPLVQPVRMLGFRAAREPWFIDDAAERRRSTVDMMRHRLYPEVTELELEAKMTRLLAEKRTKPPEPSLPSVAEAGQPKYLIFTTGSLTYSPHQIGVKEIQPYQMNTVGFVLGEDRTLEEFFDRPKIIDLHGHIIGMGLSPDHRYLYVNSRAWPPDCVISDPLQPPPIAEDIDLHVLDLWTMKEAKRALRAHRAYTPSNNFFFIFLDVSRDFVASGSEDHHGYIWDRHYDVCLAKLRHDDVVNSVAFSPVEQELLLTASDDGTVKAWRSLRAVQNLQGGGAKPHGSNSSPAAKPRP